MRRLKKGLVRNFQIDNQEMEIRFGKILDDFRPDIVHFFHLHHLSVKFIDECVKRDISTILTPTAFWPICPYSKLLLPNGNHCSGPASDKLNCLRHYLDGKLNIFAMLLRNLSDHRLRMVTDFFHRFGRTQKFLPWGISYVMENMNKMAQYSSRILKRVKMVNRIIVPTNFMAEILAGYGIDRKRMEILPYGINANYHKFPRQERTGDRLELAFIGALTSHKGLHVLVDAIKKVDATLNINVTIYGKEANADYINVVKEKVGNDKRFNFAGTFPNEKIGEIFSKADALIVPSLWVENAPLVVYSAQASRCPVIASDVSGISNVISHDKDGILFPTGDSSALAAIIHNIYKERQILARLRNQSKQPPSMADYCNRLDEIYHAVV